MSKICYRTAMENELAEISAQIAAGYKAAYAGLMNAEYLASLPDDHWAPILRGSLAGGDTCLVAEQDGIIVGSAVFGPAEADETAELHAIYLLPGEIGRGVGHGLYSAVEAAMREQGFRFCTLELLTANERAKVFYVGHGFVQSGSFTVEENGMVLACDVMGKQL